MTIDMEDTNIANLSDDELTNLYSDIKAFKFKLEWEVSRRKKEQRETHKSHFESVKVDFPESAMDISLDRLYWEFGLCLRAHNALSRVMKTIPQPWPKHPKHEQVYCTVRDILKADETTILNVRNMGQGSLDQLCDVLENVKKEYCK